MIAEKIEFESASSGSSKANLCAASIHASLPITGVTIPAFSPTSLSLSIQITSNLLDVDALTSFSTLSSSLRHSNLYCTELLFNDFQQLQLVKFGFEANPRS